MTAVTNSKLQQGLWKLPGKDKTLLGAFFAFALGALALGIAFALVVSLDAAGWITLPSTRAFTFLTLHASSVFYYWLYFVQIGVMLALLLVYTEGAQLTRGLRGIAWMALILMVAGWALNLIAPVMGAAVTYAAPLGLAGDFANTHWFYAGYVLLALGLFAAGVVGAVAAIAAKRRSGGEGVEWSAVGYAAFLWHALLIVAAVVAIMVNLPALQVALGKAPMFGDFSYTMSWSVYFHNMHYLPLLSTVLVWYALSEATTGVKSIFSERFSKLIFSLYLVLVPPTSLYHLFLEPQVSTNVKMLGSLLALLISVPTLMVFLVIVVSLQACASARGGNAVVGWVRHLPWRNPAFAAIAMATVAALAGGVLSNVLIQEKFAPLLSDTFMVPGYFHFLTVGTVTLTFLGALVYMVPSLTGHRLAWPRLVSSLPYALTAGVYVFGVAGVAAGYMGAPRRALAFDYGGAAPDAWATLMSVLGVGALIMVAAIAAYVTVLAVTAWRDGPFGQRLEELPVAVLTAADADGRPAWFGVVSIAVFVAAMYAVTLAAFWIMQTLPIQ